MPPKGERRKQQIIDTAKDMFINMGFQSTHIGQVCEELDIARGTVYQYFSNKKEILYAILDSVLERIEDVLDPDDLEDFINSSPGKDELIGFVEDRVHSCLKIISDEPIVIKLVYKEISGIDEEISDKVSKFLDDIIKVISRETKELIKTGFYNKHDDPEISASMLLGAVTMTVYQYIHSKKDYLDKSLSRSLASSYIHGAYRRLKD